MYHRFSCALARPNPHRSGGVFRHPDAHRLRSHRPSRARRHMAAEAESRLARRLRVPASLLQQLRQAAASRQAFRAGDLPAGTETIPLDQVRASLSKAAKTAGHPSNVPIRAQTVWLLSRPSFPFQAPRPFFSTQATHSGASMERGGSTFSNPTAVAGESAAAFEHSYHEVSAPPSNPGMQRTRYARR